MSRSYLDKPTLSTICDYCNKEISHEDTMQWAHIIRGYISRPTNVAQYLQFLWRKSRKYVSGTPFNEVIYDFHAECFDKLVRKYKKEQL